MMDLSSDAYLWFKAFHIISVIAWMAGLLYLPRLFVYHTQALVGSETSKFFIVMERRLLRYIMNPAMIASYIFGLLLVVAMPDLSDGWLHVKFVALAGLTASHMFMAKWRKDFERGQNKHPERFFRVANEVPTVFMIIIVIMAVVKPF